MNQVDDTDSERRVQISHTQYISVLWPDKIYVNNCFPEVASLKEFPERRPATVAMAVLSDRPIESMATSNCELPGPRCSFPKLLGIPIMGKPSK